MLGQSGGEFQSFRAAERRLRQCPSQISRKGFYLFRLKLYLFMGRLGGSFGNRLFLIHHAVDISRSTGSSMLAPDPLSPFCHSGYLDCVASIAKTADHAAFAAKSVSKAPKLAFVFHPKTSKSCQVPWESSEKASAISFSTFSAPIFPEKCSFMGSSGRPTSFQPSQ